MRVRFGRSVSVQAPDRDAPATDRLTVRPASRAPSLDAAALDLREPERETAITRLFDQHHDQLVRLAALLGAGADAEDVVGEAFCALYRKWNGLRDPAAALAYVRSAVVNQTKMQLRHRRVVEQNPERALPEAHRSAEVEVLVREDQREVVAALAALPRRQREAIVLRYWMDLREAEVADAMGVSVGAVKTHTSRAMAALGRTLGGQR